MPGLLTKSETAFRPDAETIARMEKYQDYFPEVWRATDYEGYSVSNYGRTRRGERIHNPRTNTNGYRQAIFSENGKKEYPFIHRLVWEAFVGPVPDDAEVDHIDGDKTNNRLTNLQLVSRSGNVRKTFGKAVCQYTMDGVLVKRYADLREAQTETGVAKQNIATCARGGRKCAGGYLWRYE